MFYHEKEEHENTCSSKTGSIGHAGRIVKMGPCGGGGGDARDMDMRGVNRIVKVFVRHGATVEAISVLYKRDGREEQTERWGWPVSKPSEVNVFL